MTEVAEWAEWITEAVEVEETAEDKQRRLRHLERDIRTADLSPKDTAVLMERLDAARHAASMHD